MHVATGWPDQQKVVLFEDLSLALLGTDNLLCLKQLFILVVGELVVLVFRVQLVIGCVGQLPEHEFEIDAHVRVVVERHHGALLDEEEHQTVVIVSADGHFVKTRIKMVCIGSAAGALDTQLLNLDRVHLLDDFLAERVFQAVVQEFDIVSSPAGFHAHFSDGFYKTLHNPDFVVIFVLPDMVL